MVTPIYSTELSADEELSFRHLEHHLGRHDRIVFAPDDLNPKRPGFDVVHFPARYFQSVDTYSRLLLSPAFYEAFESYDFILVYQLDCLVFSDSLLDWCRAGYDYIGAPWLVDPKAPERGFSRVGNGGLSLRRVQACLDVLSSTRYQHEPVSRLHDVLRAPLPDLAPPFTPSAIRKRLGVLHEVRRGAAWYAAHYSLNEDHFWSDRARLFLPEFQVAPVAAGLRFAFERSPGTCYAANAHRLPFGCHAWARWDRDFWAPHLLANSAQVA